MPMLGILGSRLAAVSCLVIPSVMVDPRADARGFGSDLPYVLISFCPLMHEYFLRFFPFSGPTTMGIGNQCWESVVSNYGIQ